VQRFIRETQDVCAYNLIKDPGDAISTATGSVSKERWYTDNHCAFRAGSVGSAILGFRANVAIIDDPIRSRADAESETMRESDWQWFVNDLETRLTPDGAIILIATPFHEDDLMGRLQRIQEGRWTILRLPAICDDPDTDPLRRQLNEPLWADDQYGYGERLIEIQAAAEREGRLRDFYAMYQGRPRPPEGAMFKPAKMPIIEPAMMPKIVEQVRAWDLASSAKGDWTVGLKLARAYTSAYENTFVVTDIVRFRGPPEEVRSTVKGVAQADGYFTKIWIPRDPAQAGADQADSYIRMLSGHRIDEGAVPWCTQHGETTNVCLRGGSIGPCGFVARHALSFEELAAFPRGVHDDQVDALSLAFSKLEQTDLSVWLRL
jgi:phage terminase large subunit-like protein